ncbi:PSME3-interacting protein isoform X2 [Venturia canescens]|uniref:PSME3-interacting protein isoform X2 n=1 Tax=Venturia canescens TaxID=32260 RepID=UPI001C9C6723|nr:PSME3-interacting protein isoform X2 [Venturia canescens]
MSSGFISEAEIAEQRRIRQEEWDRVRTADQPQEAPEEKYDPRSLFDRLQEQKNKRDMEYEEAHKLKNMIKGLDDDEVEFLDLVDRTKLEEERKKNMEEEKEMRDFKAAVASLQEKSMDEKLKQELKKPQNIVKNPSGTSGKNSQLRLLAGVIVKKSGQEARGTKRKISETEESKDGDKMEKLESLSRKETRIASAEKSTSEEKTVNMIEKAEISPGLKCIGILPGLGSYYDDSSDSDCSSSDLEHEQESSSTNANREKKQSTKSTN